MNTEARLSAEELTKFVGGLNRFIKNAGLSARGASRVLGVAAPTLLRWQRNAETGEQRPYRHMAAAAARKIKMLNAVHKEEGLFKSIAHLPPSEKVATLIAKLDAAEAETTV